MLKYASFTSMLDTYLTYRAVQDATNQANTYLESLKAEGQYKIIETVTQLTQIDGKPVYVITMLVETSPDK